MVSDSKYVFDIYPHIAISGNTQIVISGHRHEDDEGYCVHFNLYDKYKEKDAYKIVTKLIEKSSIKWIKPTKREWIIDTELAKKELPDLEIYPWFKGTLYIEPELDVEDRDSFGEAKQESIYRLFILKEDVLMNSNNKVFLSHKGKNKPLIREFNFTLELLGYDTWMDEDAMNAGASLDRSLLDGMKKSCAAVFFVTPEYIDEGYLETEIDYAIQEKREKGDGFQIITLILCDRDGNKGNVPNLLRRYVWKEPKNDLEALREIIKSILLIQHKPTKEA